MADPSTEKTRVLLIEDSDIDATFMSRMLTSNQDMQFTVDRCGSLAEALVKVRAEDYDVAMLDLSLPDADGLESFDQLRAVDARIPIVVITGSNDEDLALRAIEKLLQESRRLMTIGCLDG